MGRVILSVITGYVVMLVIIFVLFTVSWMALGASGAFAPGTYATSTLWIAISLALSFFAAVMGGLACAMTAKNDPRATRGLIGLVLVLGLLFTIPLLRGPTGAETMRPDGITMSQAMQNARQPIWVAVLLPFLGAAGVALGAGMRRRGGVV